MPDPIPECPPVATLRRYLIGDYTDEQGAQIEHHLSQCPACEDTLAGFDDTKDILLRHLPLAASVQNTPSNDDTSNSRPPWMDRLKAGLAKVDERVENDPVADDVAGGPNLSGLESYELLGVLGRGGMGVVYRARHRQLGRIVAIKVVHPKLASALHVRDRFEKEIRILGGMNHPGIVMATDAGRVGPAAYLVMELIDGIDLARLVREQGPLSVAQATEVARQVSLALAEAHRSNAIHRDVKPSNVMLDRSGQAKLLDFGLAHLTERASECQETSLGHVLGTLDYMAPEQADGQVVQSQTDIYGLGALLFYLLTGQPPHGSNNERTLLQQLKSITNDDVRELSSVRADVPEQLSHLVAHLLSRDPNARPGDAAQVADALEQWADGNSLACLAERLPAMPKTDDRDDVDQSLCELLGVERSTASRGKTETEVKPLQAARSFFRFKTTVFIGAIAAALFGISYGITLLIDTPQGKFHITSDVSDVQVELLDEQNVATQFTIKNKELETELKIGKYRIRILGEHDGMELNKDTIVLTKAKTEIARIRRIVERPDTESEVPQLIAPAVAATPSGEVTHQTTVLSGVADDNPNEPTFDGMPLSHWKHRLKTEKHADTMCNIAEAVLTLVHGTPSQQIQSRIRILGDLYKQAYPTNLEDVAFAIAVGGKTPHSNWSSVKKLSQLTRTAAQQSKQVSKQQVVIELCEAISTGESPAKETAFIVLSELVKSDRDAYSRAVLNNLPWDQIDTVLDQACLLLRAQLYERSDAEQRTVCETAMTSAGHHLTHQLKAAFDGEQSAVTRRSELVRFAREWVACQKKWKRFGIGLSSRDNQRVKGVDPELVATVILYEILNDDSEFDDYFKSRWARANFPYHEASLVTDRDWAYPLWENWTDVATRQLNSWQPNEHQKERETLLRALTIVLPTRTAKDNWNVEETADVIEKHLRRSYAKTKAAPPAAVTNHDLLTALLLCESAIPDFVIAGPPNDPSLRIRLDSFARLIDSDTSYDDYKRNSGEAKGLIQHAPFHTVRAIMASQDRPKNKNGYRLPQLTLIRDSSDVKDVTYAIGGSSNKARIDPLLLLAIVAKLSKNHSSTIDYDTLLSTNMTKISVGRSIRDTLQHQSPVGKIAIKWARQMKQTANDSAKAVIKKRAPGIGE